MKKLLITILILLFGLSFIKVGATSMSIEMIDGASIRLESPNGLKFMANVSGFPENAIYGFFLGKGDLSIEEVKTKTEVEVDKNDDTIAISIVNFPNEGLNQDITALAYVKVADTYYYSSNTVIKNIGNIAKQSHDDPNYISNTFIENILSNVTFDINYNIGKGSFWYLNKTEYVNAFLSDFYDFVKPGCTLPEFKTNFNNYIGGGVGGTDKLLYNSDLTANNESYFMNSSKYKDKWASLGQYVLGMNNRFGVSGQYYGGALDFYRYILNDDEAWLKTYNSKTYPYSSYPSSPEISNTYKISNNSIELASPINGDFLGWYDNSEFNGDIITNIEAGYANNINLYAKYADSVLYNLYFNSNGGTLCDSKVVNNGDNVTLPTPTRSGYSFAGWYLGKTLISSPMKYDYLEDKTLKAQWTYIGETENLSYNESDIVYRNTTTVVQIPTSYVQSETQLRAAWVSSMISSFTPSSNQTTMKNNLTEVLDLLESYNMNCIIFHVRVYNDAYYKTHMAPIDSKYGTYSSFESWDYLEWFIDECHKRGIEFHAWLNPYRIKAYGYAADATTSDVASAYEDYPLNPAHDPENILMTYRSDGTHGAILNPAKEVVQNYIIDTCLELMENYDIDAIHFDDYFYAQMSSDITVLTEPDQDDYAAYIDANPTCGYSKTSASDKKQWRRDNVDNFIHNLHDAMTEFNKTNGRSVQLGIAPTGIYKNGNGTVTYDADGTAVTNGSNTTGQSHYESYLFCDTKKWIDNEWIDYICPQSYWSFGQTVAGYAAVMDWWNAVVKYKNVNLYSGLGIYMDTYTWAQTYEASNQVLYTSKLANVGGVSFYSFNYLKSITNDSGNVKHNGLIRIRDSYWTTTVLNPKTMANCYENN